MSRHRPGLHMKVWHQIMVAPAVAIVLTVPQGAVSCGALTRQNAAPDEILVTSPGIVQPLQIAIVSAGRIADGDLSVEIRPGGSDETGQVLNAVAGMTQNLRTLVGPVDGGAHLVSEASAPIAQGNLDLSQRTEEQAGTLEQTAGALKELTSTVTRNAQHARRASQLAMDASEVARRGRRAVLQ